MTDRLVRLAGSACFLAVLAAPLAAQQPVNRSPRGFGFIRGVVYDSLLHAPLDSAHVYINGTALSTMTDAGGRFRFDSVPAGRQVIAFEHEDLDSAGFTTNVKRIDVAASRVTVVDLTVPSLETMHRAACPNGLRPGVRDSGLVFGNVTDARTGARLARARVGVSWVRAGRGPDGRVLVTRPALESTTDSLGNYYLCGAPSEYVVTVTASAGLFATGRTELLLGRRGVARRDLALSLDSLQLPDSIGLRHGTAVVMGHILDEHDVPRPSARVSVDEAAGEAFSDTDGRFALSGLPSGSQMLMVRMIGYSAVHVPVRLRGHDTAQVTIRLRAVTVLDTMRITASSTQAQIDLEDLQLRQRQGLGYFLTEEQVRRRQSMRAVVQGLPGMYIEGRSVFQFTVQTLVSGKPCPAAIYVDGLATTTDAIQSYRPDQLISVEWYPRGSQAPLKYQPMVNAECSVLLLWTRFIR
ncbi:MAG: carboxypeptidase regulatory-like domain-containing protein [Gemmatimonadales bacterium]